MVARKGASTRIQGPVLVLRSGTKCKTQIPKKFPIVITQFVKAPRGIPYDQKLLPLAFHRRVPLACIEFNRHTRLVIHYFSLNLDSWLYFSLFFLPCHLAALQALLLHPQASPVCHNRDHNIVYAPLVMNILVWTMFRIPDQSHCGKRPCCKLPKVVRQVGSYPWESSTLVFYPRHAAEGKCT